jgi:hypothetical protein
MDKIDMLAAALDLGQRDLRVFPVRPNDKRPLVKGWQNIATTDDDEIRERWGQNPRANIGIRTGDGLFVVDVDPKNGGDVNDLGIKLPKTWTSRTPSGGNHYYFSTDQTIHNSISKLAKGIDVRGDGGYIVAPPSIAGGKPYKWDRRGKIAPAPAALLAKLTSPTPSPIVNGKIPVGQRNHELYKFACSLRSRNVDERGAMAMLQGFNQHGLTEPVPDTELALLLKSAWQRAGGGHEVELPAEPFDYKAHMRRVSDILANPPDPIRYLVTGLLAEGGASILAGPPKSFKSWIALQMLLHLVVGRNLKDWNSFGTVPRKVRAALLDLEQTDALFHERLKLFGAKEEDTTNLLRFPKWAKLDAEGIQQLENLIADEKLQLVVIDTLARAKAAPARGRSATDQDAEVMDPITKLAHRTGCHILTLTHTGKRKDFDNPLDMIAATTALAGAVDDVFILYKHPDDDDEQRIRRRFFATGRHISEPGTYVLDKLGQEFVLTGTDYDTISGERQKDVMKILSTSERAMTGKDIADRLGKSRSNIAHALGKLVEQKRIIALEKGMYTVAARIVKTRMQGRE